MIIKNRSRDEPLCSRNDHRIAQQVERLTNVYDEHITIPRQQCVQRFRRDRVPLKLTSISDALRKDRRNYYRGADCHET
jgi:hypothetical protein